MKSACAALLISLVGCTNIPNPIAPQNISLQIRPNGNVMMLIPVVPKTRTVTNQQPKTSAAMCVETRPTLPNADGFLHLPNFVNFCFKVKW